MSRENGKGLFIQGESLSWLRHTGRAGRGEACVQRILAASKRKKSGKKEEEGSSLGYNPTGPGRRQWGVGKEGSDQSKMEFAGGYKGEWSRGSWHLAVRSRDEQTAVQMLSCNRRKSKKPPETAL